MALLHISVVIANLGLWQTSWKTLAQHSRDHLAWWDADEVVRSQTRKDWVIVVGGEEKVVVRDMFKVIQGQRYSVELI